MVQWNFIIFKRFSVSLPTKRRNFAASREGSVGNTVQKVVERTSRWWRLFGKCVSHNLILFLLKWKQQKMYLWCKDNADEAAAVPLEMANVAGVFYVLIIGTVSAAFYGILAFLWDTRSHAKRMKVCGYSCCSRCSISISSNAHTNAPKPSIFCNFPGFLRYLAIWVRLIFLEKHLWQKMSFSWLLWNLFDFFCELFVLIPRDAFMRQFTKSHCIDCILNSIFWKMISCMQLLSIKVNFKPLLSSNYPRKHAFLNIPLDI